jgi:hypothetical protein
VRFALAALLAALALVGCGGQGTGASAADAVPASVAGYAEVNVDLGSEQWEQVQALLDEFPHDLNVVDELNEELAKKSLDYERDVASALGPTVAVALTSTEDEDAALLTQPEDLDKWRALVAKVAEREDEEYVLGEIGGWQAVAQNQAVLDALSDGGGSLADSDAFTAALDELPAERLALIWAGGDALRKEAPQAKLEWFAGAVDARAEGAGATFVTRVSAGDAGTAYESEWVDKAPADALAFLSFDAESFRSQSSAITPFAEMLGLPIDDLLAQIGGEAALWVRAGAGLPEVTLVLEAEDAARTQATLRQLLRDVPLPLEFGVVDGVLVATTASSPEAAVQASGDKLGGSPDFEEATGTAGMPDETTGFLFVNVADALPLLELAAGLGAAIPSEALEYLQPIRTVVGWSEVEGNVATQHLFVQIQ